MNKSILLLSLLALPASLFAEATTYTVDQSHSSVSFKIRHLVSKVKGTFTDFSGKIVLDPANLSASSASGEIKIKSVNTANADRDAHLKNADFFNEPKHPVMTFKSTAFKPAGHDTYEMTGDLTFAGKTKPVTLKLVKTGEADHPMSKGAKVAGFEATGTLKRSDWGMSYGKGMVGDEVDLEIQIEAAIEKPASK
jgi:polyisoprenoid-binding protein YceI